jgi:hypothetical protein
VTAGWIQFRSAAGQWMSQERVNPVRELQRASAFYAEALRVDPGLEEARLRLGRVLHQLGNGDAAQRELAQVHTSTVVPR